MITETVKIKKDRIPYLREKIEKLNRKAFKLNCPEMILTISETETVWHELYNGHYTKADDLDHTFVSKIKRTWVEIEATLEYEIPIIDGWDLISTFDIMPGPALPDKDKNGNTVFGPNVVFTSTVPGKTLPVHYLDKTEIHCDHCGHKRYRTHSMLMKKLDDGGYREVGSTCIKDFFGHSPKAFLWMAQISFTDIISEIEEEKFGGGGGTHCYDLNQVLAYTSLAIRKDGWVSKGAAYDDPSLTPTVDNMFFYMNPPDKYKGREEFIPTVKDIELAEATVKHFLEIDPGDNDYLTNCVKLAKLGYVPIKMVGVACSMIASYKRELAKTLEKKDRPESDFVGEVKDKIEVETVKVVFVTEVYSDYGPSSLYIFVDETTGNKFKTFYSGKTWSAEMGEYVTLKGTVKEHQTYKGEKATMLTRCVVFAK